MDDPSQISIWEFLFFLSNTADRFKSFTEKLSFTRTRLEKDGNELTYKLDTGLCHIRSPDKSYQKIFNTPIDINKVHFTSDNRRVADTLQRNTSLKAKGKKKPSTQLELREMLRNPDLIKEIRETLQQAKTLLKKSRLGKSKHPSIQTNSDEMFGRDLNVPPGYWTQIKHPRRPQTAGSARSARKMRPKSSDSDFFHLTNGSKDLNQSFAYNSRPKIDRPLTAGSHRSTTKTGVRLTQMELSIKMEPYKPLNMRQATVISLMQSYSNAFKSIT